MAAPSRARAADNRVVGGGVVKGTPITRGCGLGKFQGARALRCCGLRKFLSARACGAAVYENSKVRERLRARSNSLFSRQRRACMFSSKANSSTANTRAQQPTNTAQESRHHPRIVHRSTCLAADWLARSRAELLVEGLVYLVARLAQAHRA
jgi:hypothetical protein